jgi:hypothetical protein
VVDYFDWIPDNIDPSFDQIMAAITAAGTNLLPGQTGIAEVTPTLISFNWNFIMIRHDTQVPDHDKDVGGTACTTYAVYGHGKQGSVREVFAARGVTDPKNIIGTTVQQGELIMKADDTGTSFHNHLHMHVLAGNSTTPATPPISVSKLNQYTIPFVFREAKHIIARDGVLKNLTWYKSDNEKV